MRIEELKPGMMVRTVGLPEYLRNSVYSNSTSHATGIVEKIGKAMVTLRTVGWSYIWNEFPANLELVTEEEIEG